MGFAVLDAAGRLKTTGDGASSEFSFTTTGNIDNLDFSNAALIRCNNATLSTIRGLKAGYAGQIVTIVKVGAGQVDLAHQNTNSTDVNRMINVVTGGVTSLATGGSASYQYDATTARWRLVAHEQGSPITPTFAAGNFTASGTMTWTVAAGDVETYSYIIRGKMMLLSIIVNTSTVAAPLSTELRVAIPAGFTVLKGVVAFSANLTPSGVASEAGKLRAQTSAAYVIFTRLAGANWTAGTDTTYAEGYVEFEVA